MVDFKDFKNMPLEKFEPGESQGPFVTGKFPPGYYDSWNAARLIKFMDGSEIVMDEYFVSLIKYRHGLFELSRHLTKETAYLKETLDLENPEAIERIEILTEKLSHSEIEKLTTELNNVNFFINTVCNIMCLEKNNNSKPISDEKS